MKKPDMIKLTFSLSAALIVVTLVVTFLASFLARNELAEEKRYQDFSTGWLYEDGTEVKLDYMDKTCVIHKQLPEVTECSVLSFNARNIDVDVYLEDKCVYRTTKPQEPLLTSFFGKTIGSTFIDVDIDPTDSGKTVYIDIVNPYKNASSCKIAHMYFGDAAQIVKHDAALQLGPFCFSMIILFLGIICLLLYLPMAKSNMADPSMLYLGASAFTFGMCMITDCKLLPIIVGQGSLYYAVSQLFMALLVVPLLMFFSKLYSSLNKKVVIVLSMISLVIFIGMFVSNCLGLADYHEAAVIMLLSNVVAIFYIAFTTVREFIAHPRENTFHNLGVILLAIGVVLDIAMTRTTIFVETSFFMRFGLLGFIFMECAQILWKHIENYQTGVKAQLISRLAYHDGLTDMLNRTSFMEAMEQMEREDHSDTLIAVFDINNLKFVNDNFGHTDGDNLIISVASALQEALAGLGNCYRTGGDEFVFIAKRIGVEACFLEAQYKLLSDLERRTETSPYPISAAVGYAVMGSRHNSMQELLDEADEKMYVNKKEVKEHIVLPTIPQTA